jgi:hypothetical protein
MVGAALGLHARYLPHPYGHGQADNAGTAPSQRHQHVQLIRDKGRMGWQKAVNGGRRSLGETAISRYKALIGLSLRARTLLGQTTEARAACAVLNRMTRLGMPVSRHVA